MKSKRTLVFLILAALFLAAVGAGGTFLVLTFQDRRMAEDLKLVRGFLDEKNYEEASKKVSALRERASGKEGWYPQFLGLKLELERAEGKDDAAKSTAAALLDSEKKYTGPAVLQAHIYLGEKAIEQENAAEAKKHFDAILANPAPDAQGAEIAKLGLLRIRMAAEGATKEVQKELLALLEQYPNSEYKGDIEYALGQCNLAQLLSPELGEGDEVYVIAKGDSIFSMAKKFKIPQEILMKVNGITNPNRLSIGRRLKIPNVDFSILVDKSANTLTLISNGKFFKRYTVRTGKVDYLTPVGEFKITDKRIDPDWNDPKSGKHYPGGDPGNELGTRWMAFQGSSLGIHGTIDPTTIGKYASSGCVGMLQEDVEELYDLVRIGTPVKIVGKIQDDSVKAPAVAANADKKTEKKAGKKAEKK